MVAAVAAAVLGVSTAKVQTNYALIAHLKLVENMPPVPSGAISVSSIISHTESATTAAAAAASAAPQRSMRICALACA